MIMPLCHTSMCLLGIKVFLTSWPWSLLLRSNEQACIQMSALCMRNCRNFLPVWNFINILCYCVTLISLMVPRMHATLLLDHTTGGLADLTTSGVDQVGFSQTMGTGICYRSLCSFIKVKTDQNSHPEFALWWQPCRLRLDMSSIIADLCTNLISSQVEAEMARQTTKQKKDTKQSKQYTSGENTNKPRLQQTEPQDCPSAAAIKRYEWHVVKCFWCCSLHHSDVCETVHQRDRLDRLLIWVNVEYRRL